MIQCRNCGSMNSIDLASCVACNHSFIRSIVLEGALGSVSASLRTAVGSALLQLTIGDDARFAATEQFYLNRSIGGPWFLLPKDRTRNATFVNGASVPSAGVELKDGDEISLAGKAGRMRVRIVREQ